MINTLETVTSAVMAKIDSARSMADSQIDVTARRDSFRCVPSGGTVYRLKTRPIGGFRL
jgi:hypothetical protein